MANRTIVPFGPQHPVLPEPIHLDLVLEDEKVVEAIPSIGFVHRGLEELAGRRDFHDYQYVVERICGICSFKHGMAYCETLEQIFGAEVPPRAKYLRTIWASWPTPLALTPCLCSAGVCGKKCWICLRPPPAGE